MPVCNAACFPSRFPARLVLPPGSANVAAPARKAPQMSAWCPHCMVGPTPEAGPRRGLDQAPRTIPWMDGMSDCLTVSRQQLVGFPASPFFINLRS